MTWQSVGYFLLWAGLFAVMMRFGCGAHVMGHGHSHDETSPHSGGADSSSTATDPVCGMSVATADAKTALYRGKAFYFCSAACREKFEAAPSTYAKG
jgi:YHS domain-containing protein